MYSLLLSFLLTSFISSDSHAQTSTGNDLIKELGKSLKSGDSLKGKNIMQLLTGWYNVEAAGGVENFGPWTMIVKKAEVPEGYINVRLNNVRSGYVEGFSSHHVAGTARGSWMRYSLLIDSDIYLHFMYSFPYSHDFHTNWLAVALCGNDDSTCRTLTASKMYYNNYPFMDKKSYYNPPFKYVKTCFDNLCVMGLMGGSHKPVITIKLIPKSYYELATIVIEKLLSLGLTRKDYEEYVKKEFS